MSPTRRPRPPVRRGGAAGVAAGVAVLAVAGAAAGLTRPAPPGAVRASRVAVSGAVLVCPDLRRIPGVLNTVAVVGTGHPGPGAVSLTPASGPQTSPVRLLGPGQVVGVYRGPVTGPVVLRATGALTGGLVAEQLSRANQTADRGWADVACQRPQAVQWFVGPGTLVGQTPVLTLVNPDSVAALVNVAVLTPAGLASDPAGQGIAVQPHSVVRIPLAQLAPGVAASAVQVSVVSGQAAAALRDVRVDGLVPLGTDWVPETAGPAPRVVVAGVPGLLDGSPPGRTLVLADPAGTEATATVTLTTSAGTFVPTGLASVSVPAQSVRTVDLGGAAGTSPATVRVTSSGAPLLAGVLVDAGASGPVRDLFYLGASAPLAGPALVPDNPVAAHEDSVLELAAPAGAASVTVTSPPQGTVPARLLHVAVPAGRAVELSLRHAGIVGGPVTVTPDPGSGPVYATRVIEEQGAYGPLVAALGLVGAPPLLTVPPVRPGPLLSGLR